MELLLIQKKRRCNSRHSDVFDLNFEKILLILIFY